jgi:hypothetical protein
MFYFSILLRPLIKSDLAVTKIDQEKTALEKKASLQGKEVYADFCMQCLASGREILKPLLLTVQIGSSKKPKVFML